MVREIQLTRHLLLSSLVLALLAAGCRTSYSPRDAASERVRFLRQHGSSLTPAQVRLIHQVPYQSRSSDRSLMNSILRGEETGERATWRAIRLSSVGGTPATGAPGDGTPSGAGGERGLSSCPEGDLRRYGDDFSSPQERRRFAELPPILPEDLLSVDLDRLSDAL